MYDADGYPVYYGGYYKDYWKYSGHGGAVYIENDSDPQFIDCNFVNNNTYGGLSGLGGIPFPTPDVRMTIENFGGAVYACYGSAPEFIRCNFAGNTADTTLDPNTYVWPDAPEDVYVSYGGTIASEDDTSMKLTDCTITGGDACVGGGIYWSNSEMAIIDCNISDSTAYLGAGLYSADANGAITGTTLTRNHAYIEPFTIPTDANGVPDPNGAFMYDPGLIFGQGGGYYSLSSLVDIGDSVFVENEASVSGGGIYYGGSDELFSDNQLLHNSLLTGNRAARDGGAVSVNWFAGLTISNCTITDNVVSGSIGEGAGFGGGLYCSYQTSVEVINSIIWDNFAIDGAQIAVAAGSKYQRRPSELTVTYTDIGPPFDPNQLRLDIGDDENGLGSVVEGDGGPRLVDAKAIYDKFDAGDETVDVIVTLVDPSAIRAITNWDSPESVSVLTAEISRRQSTVVSSLTPVEFTSKYTYENLSALSGSVTMNGLSKLLANPTVAHIEPVRIVEPMLRQAINLASALEVRQVYDGTGIAIAVVDTGVDYTHPLLGGGGFPNSKVIGGYDFGANDRDPMPDPAPGFMGLEAHGTACAGIAAGSLGNFGDYIGGVAPNAKIYAMKVTWVGTGGASPFQAFSDSLIASWDWCVTHRNDDPTNPIKVISTSMGIPGMPFNDPHVADAFSPAATHAADTAVGVGITLLVSSGNDGFPGWGISWPSAISKVISVGAVFDMTDQVTGYSNAHEMLDILAPADPVYTLDIAGLGGFTPGDYWPGFNGTSSSCPFAAGCVADIQHAARSKLGRYLTPYEVRNLLAATGDPVTDTKVDLTKPRVNLGRAITGSSGPPIYVEKDCILNDWTAPDSNSYWAWDPNWDPDSFNIEEDPFFIAGYYLSQEKAGQVVESNCVDGGLGLASDVGLDTYTTRIDDFNDVDEVDMGYHYRQGLAIYELTVNVVADMNDPGIDGTGIHGTVDPNSGRYYDGRVVTLTAYPDEGYFLKGWYDANDVRVSVAREFDVVMDSDQVLFARFRTPIEIEVSGGGEALYDAVTVAENGDTLILAAGTYNGDIDFRGKEIALVSANPDDPNIVAGTIIDCQNSTRGFTFDNGEGPGALIDGLTIINGGLFAQPGGGIYIGSDSSPTIVNVVITDCNVSFAGGGGIYVDANSSPIFRNVTINNCFTSTSGSGGGIFIDANSAPIFETCTITNCSAAGYGGGFYSNTDSNSTFIDCNFAGNHADFSGGAIYTTSDTTSTLNLCVFTANTADVSGGAIYHNVGCVSDVVDCNFSGNSAAGTVSITYLPDMTDPNSLVTITDSSLGKGGAINCNEDTQIRVAGTYFGRNAADYGGALYFDANCAGDVNDCVLIHNAADEDGGAIYLSDSNGLSVVDCNVAFNTSVRGGGLFCVDSPDSAIVDCTIRYNRAARVATILDYFLPDPNDPSANIPVDPGDPNFDPTDPNLIIVTSQDVNGVAQGGGIYSFAGPNSISGCYISNNVTSTSGGGLYFAANGNQVIDFTNCLVTKNRSGRDGGGISCNWFSDLNISHCTIADNITGDVNDPHWTGYGGGLYCSYDANSAVTNSIIWNNHGFVGTQIYVGTGFEPDPRPSRVSVSHSDVMGWQVPGEPGAIDPNAVFVDVNCLLDWSSATIFDKAPLFVGGYYLSQEAGGQAIDSPALNAGSAPASVPGFGELTTALSGIPDSGWVDLGYHFRIIEHRLTVEVVGEGGTFTIDPLLDPYITDGGLFNYGTAVTLKAVPDEGYRVNGWYDVNDVLLSTDDELEIVVDSNETIILEFEPVQTIMVRGSGNYIQLGIDAAKDGDTVVVYAGTYDGDINLGGKAITVVSSNPDDANIVANTIVDCNAGTRGFVFNMNEDANTVVDGFTVINGGVAGEHGGGVFIDVNTHPTLINMVIRDCNATGADPNDPNSQVNGGAIYVGADSSPTFVNVTVMNCSATEGGGAFCDFNSTPIFDNCTFLDNSADSGGGLAYDSNCVSIVIGCTFWGNSADDPIYGSGGGLRCDPNSVITVADCNFTENTAVMGAGLYGDPNSELAVRGSAFTDNDASDYGGGMFWYGAMEITDCNIAYNTAPLGGGLMSVYSPETTITGSMLWYNRAALPLPGDPNVVVDPNDPNSLIIIDPNIITIIGQGGGMFCFATPAVIRDTVVAQNIADTSGGGLYIAGNLSEAEIINCLITNNAAGRDGGGISANWYSKPYVANCTVAGNAAVGTSGELDNTGLGGGLYVSYHANANVNDSIFWDNYALQGHEMFVGTGFEFDPRPGTLGVYYSNVKDGPDDIYHEGCPEPEYIGNIDEDPLFVSGLLDGYYLSQVVSGQPEDSPCVRNDDPDTGVTYVSDVGLVGYTTRTDGVSDTGIVNMGYHRLMLEPCMFCDIDRNGKIDFFDFAVLAQTWLEEGCSEDNGWCGGGDVTFDMKVYFEDVAFMADCWLVEDIWPPLPDPAEWEVEPYLSGTTAQMTAVKAVDMWGWPVEYFFECVRGDCDDSGWISSRTYIDEGLTSGVKYGYRVKAHDTSPRENETGWSEIVYVGDEDTTPPTALMWLFEPYATSWEVIAMMASAEDASGVEYFFQNITIPDHESGWQDEPNWIDTGLEPNTVYCYQVRARDKSPAQNMTIGWSDTKCAITWVLPDLIPPVPNPMMWDVNDPNLLPTTVWVGPDATLDWGATMTCAVAVDPSGPVEYYFERVDDPSFNSGWIAVNTWDTPAMGNRLSGWDFRVKARDIYLNETAWSYEVKAFPLGIPRPPEYLPPYMR